VIGMVWSGLVCTLRPDQTRCLHKDRSDQTGPTNKTAKNEAEEKEETEEMYFTTNYQSSRLHSHYPRYRCFPHPGAFHTRPGDTHMPL